MLRDHNSHTGGGGGGHAHPFETETVTRLATAVWSSQRLPLIGRPCNRPLGTCTVVKMRRLLRDWVTTCNAPCSQHLPCNQWQLHRDRPTHSRHNARLLLSNLVLSVFFFFDRVDAVGLTKKNQTVSLVLGAGRRLPNNDFAHCNCFIQWKKKTVKWYWNNRVLH